MDLEAHYDFLFHTDDILEESRSKANFLTNEFLYTQLKNDLIQIFLSDPSTSPNFRTVRFHGSRMAGLANDNSTLDAFVEMGKNLEAYLGNEFLH